MDQHQTLKPAQAFRAISYKPEMELWDYDEAFEAFEKGMEALIKVAFPKGDRRPVVVSIADRTEFLGATHPEGQEAPVGWRLYTEGTGVTAIVPNRRTKVGKQFGALIDAIQPPEWGKFDLGMQGDAWLPANPTDKPGLDVAVSYPMFHRAGDRLYCTWDVPISEVDPLYWEEIPVAEFEEIMEGYKPRR